jgi:hypothetical protein
MTNIQKTEVIISLFFIDDSKEVFFCSKNLIRKYRPDKKKTKQKISESAAVTLMLTNIFIEN